MFFVVRSDDSFNFLGLIKYVVIILVCRFDHCSLLFVSISLLSFPVLMLSLVCIPQCASHVMSD